MPQRQTLNAKAFAANPKSSYIDFQLVRHLTLKSKTETVNPLRPAHGVRGETVDGHLSVHDFPSLVSHPYLSGFHGSVSVVAIERNGQQVYACLSLDSLGIFLSFSSPTRSLSLMQNVSCVGI